jgi:hypothetical protein
MKLFELMRCSGIKFMYLNILDTRDIYFYSEVGRGHLMLLWFFCSAKGWKNTAYCPCISLEPLSKRKQKMIGTLVLRGRVDALPPEGKGGILITQL